MEIFGGLIEFNDKKEFIEFMDKIDDKNAIKLLEISMNYAIKSGLFDFDESYAMYKCLLKLKSNEDSEANHLSNDDPNGSPDSV
jgi:hypothetical protein